MKRKIIIIEEKMIKIESPSWIATDMGGSSKIRGVKYFDEPFISEKHSTMLLERAKEIYKENNYQSEWIAIPTLSVYWHTLEKQIENL